MFEMNIISVETKMSPQMLKMDPKTPIFTSDCQNTKNSNIPKIPIIDVYGIDSSGHKTCMHVHNFFPFLYVPLFQVTAAICGSENLSIKIKLFLCKLNSELRKTSKNIHSTKNFIFDYEIFKSTSIYGFQHQADFVKVWNLKKIKHTFSLKKISFFLTKYNLKKIYFIHPKTVPNAAKLIRTPALFSRHFDVYEAHIPFRLQFFVNFNLSGMGLLKTSNCSFRPPFDIISENRSFYAERSNGLIKSTFCQIEADVDARFIFKGVDYLSTCDANELNFGFFFYF